LSILYADSSALARMYLGDESGSQELESLLHAPGAAVATSELCTAELAGAAGGAERAGRIESAAVVLAAVDADLQAHVQLLRLAPETILPVARRLVLAHRLRALDAIHLAVALELGQSEPEDVVFVTRDADQAAAAKALGLSVL
jgi:uncharacterized protein